MDSYLMMLYVTLEQESALKQFFLEHGWPYSKPDLSITTDKLGPANCSLVSISSLHSQPTSDIVESAKCSQVPSTAPDIAPISQKPGKRKAKPPPRYAVKTKQAKVAQKQHSTPTSKQKDTMTYIDIDTAGPSNVSEDPSNIEAGPSNTAAGPSNTEASPSNISAGPSNTAVGLSKTAAKTVKVLSITGLDGKETEIKIEVPDAEYEQDSVDQDNGDNNTENNDDDDDDDYNDNDDDNGEDTDIDYSYEGLGQNISPKTVKHSKSGANKTASVSKEQSDGTEKSTQASTAGNSERPQCDICFKTFSSHLTLSKHKLSHSSRDFLCDLCPRTYFRRHDLKEHVRSCHGGEKDRFICDMCGASFVFRDALKKHIQSVHENIRYPCAHCNRQFVTKYSKMRHEKVHQERSTCTNCFKQFIHIEQHQKKCAEEYRPRNHMCPLCQKGFCDERNMKEHMLSVHGPHRYACGCGKTFSHRKTCIGHKRKCAFAVSESIS